MRTNKSGWWWIVLADSERTLGAVIIRAGSERSALNRSAAHIPRGAMAIALQVPPHVGDPPDDVVSKRLDPDQAQAVWRRWYPSDPRFGGIEIRIARLSGETPS